MVPAFELNGDGDGGGDVGVRVVAGLELGVGVLVGAELAGAGAGGFALGDLFGGQVRHGPDVRGGPGRAPHRVANACGGAA